MTDKGNMTPCRGKLVLGVTGSLATGKSTVADMMASMGADRIDADLVAHRLLKDNGAVKDLLVGLFGSEILEGGHVSREKLGEKVFGDPAKLGKLNGIMHPVLAEKILDNVRKAQKEVVVIDAPLLFEAGLERVADHVIVVTADEDKQLERAEKRGMTRARAKAIIDLQLPLCEKERIADFIIDNNGSLESTREQVEELWSRKLRIPPEGKKNWTS